MKLVKLGAASLNQTPLDWAGNRDRILAAIDAARRQQVSILCLPELCLTGYNCEDAFHSPGLHRTALDVLAEVAPATHGMAVAVGMPLMFQKALYNTGCLLVDGKIAGFGAKRFLAGDGIYYEPRWFKPWRAGHRTRIEIDEVDYPIGDWVWDLDGVRVGFEICEDAWVATRPGAQLALRGVDVILNPSASHFAFGKFGVRQRFVAEGSRAFGVSYVYANHLGTDAGRMIFDGGSMIADGGDLVAIGPRFSFQDQVVTAATVDVQANQMRQARTGSFQPELEGEGEGRLEVAMRYPDLEPAPRKPVPAAWEGSTDLQEEEFTRALSLALFDYMRKSRSNGFVISLSGGADSCGLTCLVSTMCELSVADLGMAGVIQRLGYLPALADAKTPRDLVGKLLVTAYQSTRNSGPVTLNAARTVAEAVGAEFLELDVDAQVQGYIQMISAAIGRELTWERDDVTLQNIQARARGPSVWMLANLRGALLLATSNRSEAAVGYATMDGDTCGGLSPIAGIDKAFLRRWLRWLESKGPVGLHPIPQLSVVNAQAPTAELRPPTSQQTDEGDLMPYDLLDAIEGSAIRDKHTPVEVLREVRVQFPQYPLGQLAVWVDRFFKLWCRNQWKRERYAPSFHVDDENLDPKTWCRFPILSGGFTRELAEMHDWVARQTTK
jgi:NAD+ synthase (glutamine-hydrolysing)